jgi:mono/diheme cytochrome c family protein
MKAALRAIPAIVAAAGLTGSLTLLSLPRAARADEPGKALFMENCSGCHGETGMADTKKGTMLKAAKLHGDAKLQGADGVDIVMKTVREKKIHQKVSKALTDDQLREVAQFVKTLASAP